MSWQRPDTAPRDGITMVLGDFGDPWPTPGVWCEHDEHWCVVSVQCCPMKGGRTDTYFETDTEPHANLRRWHPMPAIPKD